MTRLQPLLIDFILCTEYIRITAALVAMKRTRHHAKRSTASTEICLAIIYGGGSDTPHHCSEPESCRLSGDSRAGDTAYIENDSVQSTPYTMKILYPFCGETIFRIPVTNNNSPPISVDRENGLCWSACRIAKTSLRIIPG